MHAVAGFISCYGIWCALVIWSSDTGSLAKNDKKLYIILAKDEKRKLWLNSKNKKRRKFSPNMKIQIMAELWLNPTNTPKTI